MVSCWWDYNKQESISNNSNSEVHGNHQLCAQFIAREPHTYGLQMGSGTVRGELGGFPWPSSCIQAWCHHTWSQALDLCCQGNGACVTGVGLVFRDQAPHWRRLPMLQHPPGSGQSGLCGSSLGTFPSSSHMAEAKAKSKASLVCSSAQAQTHTPKPWGNTFGRTAYNQIEDKLV